MQNKELMARFKELLSIKGLIGVVLAAAGAWLIGSTLNLLPDTIPVIGHVDTVVFAVALYYLGMRIYGLVKKK